MPTGGNRFFSYLENKSSSPKSTRLETASENIPPQFESIKEQFRNVVIRPFSFETNEYGEMQKMIWLEIDNNSFSSIFVYIYFASKRTKCILSHEREALE
jgi:hypothetical protein